MTPRPPIFWRDAIGALQLLTIAGGVFCLAATVTLVCSPYLLARWLWCVCTGRPW